MTVNTLPTAAEVIGSTQTNAEQKNDFESMLDFLLQNLGSKSGQGPQAVASAASVDLDAVTETRDIVISGAAAITGFIVEAGKVFRCRASGAFTLTNNSGIVTQRGANIIAVSGDTFILRATATNTVEVLCYCRSGVWSQGEGGTGTNTPTTQLAQIQTTQSSAFQTGSTVIPVDNTKPQITEGNEYMTVTITPKNAASKLVIESLAIASTSSSTAYLTAALFQDAAANALKATTAVSRTASDPYQLSIRHEMAAGTISPITFRIRIGASNAGTTTFNGSAGGGLFDNTLSSFITVSEYLPIP